MKLRIASLILVCLALAVIPAVAQDTLYDNGKVNGTTDAWTINFGYIVSDTFNLSSAATVKDFHFWVWEFPGDKALSVDWSITSQEFGGTTYGSGTAAVSDVFISANQYGYNVDRLDVSGLNVALGAGTYWLNLQNAVTQGGNPLYWDENSGPSQASESALGTIPSEAFYITGSSGSSTTTSGQTPEPTSIMLFGSGILGLAGILRRKLF